MNAYAPRRCSTRWLDADCPAEVLCIIDHGADSIGRYDVIYAEMSEVQYEGSSRVERWLQGALFTERGASCDHFELQAHQVAAYRYRMKHRYATWSSLPDAVKDAVRRDIAEAQAWAAKCESEANA